MKDYAMVVAYASQYKDEKPKVSTYVVDLDKKLYDKLKDKVGTVVTDNKVADELFGYSINLINLAFEYPFLEKYKNNTKGNVTIVSVSEYEWSV